MYRSKTLKKIVTILLTTILAFSLYACGSEETKNEDKKEDMTIENTNDTETDETEESQTENAVTSDELDARKLFDEAYQKTNSLNAMDANMVMDMDMEAEGEHMQMLLEMDIQFDGVKSNNMIFKMPMTTVLVVDGKKQTASMNIYYVDGCYYMDGNGQKIKNEIGAEQMQQMIEKNYSTPIMESAWLTDIELEKNQDSYVLYFEADVEKMKDSVKDIQESFESMDGSGTIDEFVVEKYTGTCKINKELYMTTYDIIMEAKGVANGEIINLKYSISIEYNNPGAPVSIEIPDLSGYVEQ